jgi:hypothetical protein
MTLKQVELNFFREREKERKREREKERKREREKKRKREREKESSLIMLSIGLCDQINKV